MAIEPSLKVLVVDDNHAVLELVTAIFERLGCFVKKALGGKEALQAFSAAQYDLLVTDFEMPDLNGYQLATAVKADSPQTTVLIMTGLDRSEVAAEVNSGLVDGWLFKPFSIDTVCRHLDKFV